MRRSRYSAPTNRKRHRGGDVSFTASGDTSDLIPGDWLIVNEKDNTVAEIVVVDWAQVASVAGPRVNVTAPFRTTFPNTHPWEPANGGLAFYKVPALVSDVEFRNFTLLVPDSGTGAPGISVFGSQNVTIDDVSVQDENGQALYSYIAQGVTIQNSSGSSGKRTNEFGASVDLELSNNRFSSGDDAGFGLDFGTAFLQADGNVVSSSVNSGVYVLYGVHDGAVTNNTVDFVNSSGNAVGILVRGSTNLTITNNTLIG
jgi:hypothetical protein